VGFSVGYEKGNKKLEFKKGALYFKFRRAGADELMQLGG
jgi:hypothetical protein